MWSGEDSIIPTSKIALTRARCSSSSVNGVSLVPELADVAEHSWDLYLLLVGRSRTGDFFLFLELEEAGNLQAEAEEAEVAAAAAADVLLVQLSAPAEEEASFILVAAAS